MSASTPENTENVPVPHEPAPTHVPYTGVKETPDHSEEHPPPTTTHSTWGAGEPRLLVTSDTSDTSDTERFTFPLTEDETRIGGATGCHVVLPGIDPLHATITHDERDEFVLVLHGEGEMNANPEASGTDVAGQVREARSEVLRTGARFTAGPWRFVYMRAEFADHGRPFGGRVGGEYSDQPPQPARPDYSDPASPEWSGCWEVQDD